MFGVSPEEAIFISIGLVFGLAAVCTLIEVLKK
jgi:hypothetical protein